MASTLAIILQWSEYILLYGWPLILALWFIILKIVHKKWPVEAIIIEKRGENLIKTNDRAGKYYDSFTGITGYKLQKSKDTVPVINYDWVLHNVVKPTTLFEKLNKFLRPDIGTLFLFRYGSKQYKPIKIAVKGNIKTNYQEVKDEEGNPVYISVYQQFDPRDKLGALDFEVVDWDNMNFMVQEQRAVIDRTRKKNDWIKTIAVPLVIIGVAAVVSIVMIKFSFDYSTTAFGNAPASSNAPAEKPNIPIISDVIPGK